MSKNQPTNRELSAQAKQLEILFYKIYEKIDLLPYVNIKFQSSSRPKVSLIIRSINQKLLANKDVQGYMNSNPQIKLIGERTLRRMLNLSFAAIESSENSVLEQNFKKSNLEILTTFAFRYEWPEFLGHVDNYLREEGETLRSIIKAPNVTIFVANYFSILKSKIRPFIICILPEPIYDSNNNISYEVNIWAFHEYGQQFEEERLEYKGKIIIGDKMLQISARHINEKIPLNIICTYEDEIDIMDRQPLLFKKKRNFIRGSIQACSLKDIDAGVINFETVLIRLTHREFKEYIGLVDTLRIKEDWSFKDILSEYEVQTLNFYLVTKRNSFRVRKSNIKSLLELTTKGFKISNYTNLIGTYRIWNFGTEVNQIYQTKFTIYKDGMALLEPYVEKAIQNIRINSEEDKNIETNKNDIIKIIDTKLREQSCVINIAGIIPNKEQIVAVTFAKALNLYNVATFEAETAINGGIANGAFTTVGYDGKSANCAYFVIQKYEEEFEPQIINYKPVSVRKDPFYMALKRLNLSKGVTSIIYSKY